MSRAWGALVIALSEANAWSGSCSAPLPNDAKPPVALSTSEKWALVFQEPVAWVALGGVFLAVFFGVRIWRARKRKPN